MRKSIYVFLERSRVLSPPLLVDPGTLLTVDLILIEPDDPVLLYLQTF